MFMNICNLYQAEIFTRLGSGSLPWEPAPQRSVRNKPRLHQWPKNGKEETTHPITFITQGAVAGEPSMYLVSFVTVIHQLTKINLKEQRCIYTCRWVRKSLHGTLLSALWSQREADHQCSSNTWQRRCSSRSQPRSKERGEAAAGCTLPGPTSCDFFPLPVPCLVSPPNCATYITSKLCHQIPSPTLWLMLVITALTRRKQKPHKLDNCQSSALRSCLKSNILFNP